MEKRFRSAGWRLAMAGVVAAGLAGCGVRGIPFLGSSLALYPSRTTIAEGDTVSLDVRGADEDGVEWSTSDTAVVRIVKPGVIAAVGLGRARVTVTRARDVARTVVYVERAVLVGAGDIAVCGYEADERTAELLDHMAGIVWTAGDNAYPSGSRRNFRDCYDRTWGRHKERTRPTPGNHEYRTPDASAYFDYFGEAAGERGKGWYAYRHGGWLILALNSNLSELGPDRVDEQMKWLGETLEAQGALCTLAYFHHPLFSSGSHGNNEDAYDDENVRPIFDALYEAGADVVLVGHDHHYERFAPMDPAGRVDLERGIRQFLVGTGGGVLRGMGVPHPNSEVFSNSTHGVLELVLHPDGYEWEFVAIDGRGVDSGRDFCH